LPLLLAKYRVRNVSPSLEYDGFLDDDDDIVVGSATPLRAAASRSTSSSMMSAGRSDVAGDRGVRKYRSIENVLVAVSDRFRLNETFTAAYLATAQLRAAASRSTSSSMMSAGRSDVAGDRGSAPGSGGSLGPVSALKAVRKYRSIENVLVAVSDRFRLNESPR
jgi:hypothetical protein